MVYIAYFTELNLQICDYEQKRRICRENSKYAFDGNSYDHFCPLRKAANVCYPALLKDEWHVLHDLKEMREIKELCIIENRYFQLQFKQSNKKCTFSRKRRHFAPQGYHPKKNWTPFNQVYSDWIGRNGHNISDSHQGAHPKLSTAISPRSKLNNIFNSYYPNMSSEYIFLSFSWRKLQKLQKYSNISWIFK